MGRVVSEDKVSGVCVSCDQFLGAQTAENLQALAAVSGERLRQLARLLGTQVPTYILLTKLDRVPGFAEFVRNLSSEEGSQLLGASPAPVSSSSGYAESATAAYDDLVFALGSARLDLLSRETDPSRLDPTYEFPRELGKFRNNLATYLVELVRPSQLDANPYLRGFYVTGIRAQTRQQPVASAAAYAPRTQFDPGATSVFSPAQAAAALPQQPVYSTSIEIDQPRKAVTAFQAPQALVPGASADVLIGPTNKSYVDVLLALNGAIAQVAGNPAGASDPFAAAPISASATAAHLAAQRSAQAFHIDPVAHADASTLALMEAPITSAEGLVRGIGPAAANAGGKSFCAAYAALFAKVPFNPNGSVQATPAEVAALFQPGTGSLWQFYNANLKAILIQQGMDYAQAPNAPMQANPAFVRFFSRAAQLSQELFPPGATGPSLTFVLRNLPSSGIQTSLVKVDAQTLANTDATRQFNWSAQTATSAGLTANNLPLTFTGPWSVFQLFAKAKSQKTGSAYDLSFPLEVANTAVKGPDGTPVVAHFELSGREPTSSPPEPSAPCTVFRTSPPDRQTPRAQSNRLPHLD